MDDRKNREGDTMAIRPILRFPHPDLNRVCDRVTTFDAELAALAQDLADTMRAAPGVGITAAHIGVARRVVVIELEGQAAPRIFVNPEILDASQETQEFNEGSVSMPGAIEKVTRPARIRLRWQSLDGQTGEEEMSGFLSTCMQHEIDQLDGLFWLQRLSRLKRDRLIRKWEKAQR